MANFTTEQLYNNQFFTVTDKKRGWHTVKYADGSIVKINGVKNVESLYQHLVEASMMNVDNDVQYYADQVAGLNAQLKAKQEVCERMQATIVELQATISELQGGITTEQEDKPEPVTTTVESDDDFLARITTDNDDEENQEDLDQETYDEWNDEVSHAISNKDFEYMKEIREDIIDVMESIHESSLYTKYSMTLERLDNAINEMNVDDDIF